MMARSILLIVAIVLLGAFVSIGSALWYANSENPVSDIADEIVSAETNGVINLEQVDKDIVTEEQKERAKRH